MSWKVVFVTVLFPLPLVDLLVMDLVEIAHIQLELRLLWDEQRTHHS